MDKDVNQFVGQRLYKALHTGKLSKRAQEVTGMPLINYNINYNCQGAQKEPLKRTFSAFAGTTNSGKFAKIFIREICENLRQCRLHKQCT